MKAVDFSMAAIACVLGLSSPADATMRCDIHTKFACKPSGCGPITPAIVVGVDMDKRTYIRCDDKECNEYKIQISQSGLYFNLSSAENGFLSKMMLDGSVFVEIVTVSTNVLVSYGTCEAMR